MNGNNYLLDTNSLIYAFKEGFVFPPYNYFVSIISEIELLSYHKLSRREEIILKEALSNFDIVNINEEIKKETINIRKSTKIKLPDSLIIATAIYTNSILVTSDKQLLNSDIITTIQLQDLRNKQ
jgi:predicted nucleic acid-binding protein